MNSPKAKQLVNKPLQATELKHENKVCYLILSRQHQATESLQAGSSTQAGTGENDFIAQVRTADHSLLATLTDSQLSISKHCLLQLTSARLWGPVY